MAVRKRLSRQPQAHERSFAWNGPGGGGNALRSHRPVLQVEELGADGGALHLVTRPPHLSPRRVLVPAFKQAEGDGPFLKGRATR